jgi:hypothetical protein
MPRSNVDHQGRDADALQLAVESDKVCFIYQSCSFGVCLRLRVEEDGGKVFVGKHLAQPPRRFHYRLGSWVRQGQNHSRLGVGRHEGARLEAERRLRQKVFHVRRTAMVSKQVVPSLKQGLQKVLCMLSRKTQAAGAEDVSYEYIIRHSAQVGRDASQDEPDETMVVQGGDDQLPQLGRQASLRRHCNNNRGGGPTPGETSDSGLLAGMEVPLWSSCARNARAMSCFMVPAKHRQ